MIRCAVFSLVAVALSALPVSPSHAADKPVFRAGAFAIDVSPLDVMKERGSGAEYGVVEG